MQTFLFPLVCTQISQDGLGAVLCQDQEGRERAVVYASRSLTRSERLYPVHKQEFLALKWAVTDKFHDYLYFQNFTVLTDNNPLTYVLTSAKLDAAGHRWLASLSCYNFSIKYRPGHKNVDADILSRLPKRYKCEDETDSSGKQDRVELSSQIVGALCSSLHCRAAQQGHPVIGKFVRCVINKTRPKLSDLPPGVESQQLLRYFDKLRIVRGVLYRERTVANQEHLQLVLPKKYHHTAMVGCHDDVGHLGRDRTLQLLHERFYWPKMLSDVEEKLRCCERCLMRKTPI